MRLRDLMTAAASLSLLSLLASYRLTTPQRRPPMHSADADAEHLSADHTERIARLLHQIEEEQLMSLDDRWPFVINDTAETGAELRSLSGRGLCVWLRSLPAALAALGGACYALPHHLDALLADADADVDGQALWHLGDRTLHTPQLFTALRSKERGIISFALHDV
ncbi:uncharacterized protein LOC126470809 [Schistocerca serialis cubense]|uniref:uncharacterized protein LOC126470809 n=1 Tax=Schistocerca serialis cubense TaxID=2023355 RepID=UPI00214E287F|nr:uncharacterized protein LOC126470809 [Schistocerca serialis cubense]